PRLRWGTGQISIRELLDSSSVFEHRVRSVLAGYFDPKNRTLDALMHRLPQLPHAAALPVLFLFLATVGMLGSCLSALGEELGWRGFLVPQLAKVTSFPRVA